MWHFHNITMRQNMRISNIIISFLLLMATPLHAISKETYDFGTISQDTTLFWDGELPMYTPAIDYYPFGSLIAESQNAEQQPYLYNGKELDRMNGIDWYDYGARMLVHIDVYGQTFYNLLKEVIDSTMTKAILKEKKSYIFDNAYKPYKFEYGKLSKNSNKEQKYNYVGDFNAFLGNDTIVVNSFQKDLRHCKENIFCHHFTKLKWHSFYYLGTNYIVYIYNQSTMSWEKSDKRLTYAKWLNEIELKKRTYLLDCIDQALKEFLETVAFPSTNSILVIDNSLGEHCNYSAPPTA